MSGWSVVQDKDIPKEGQKFSQGKLPLYTMIFEQFPLALQEVCKCSMAGNKKYELDTDWKNFKRVKNPSFQYKNAAIRHLFQEGEVEDMKEYGGCRHDAATIWNLLADLQIKLENEPTTIPESTQIRQ